MFMILMLVPSAKMLIMAFLWLQESGLFKEEIGFLSMLRKSLVATLHLTCNFFKHGVKGVT